MNRDLYEILRLRRIPAAPEGLAERIIAEALRQRQAGEFSLAEFWRIFSDGFLLPRPAFALAAALLIGLTVGFGAEIKSLFVDRDSEAYAAYDAVDGSYEDGMIL